jgi:hypothetical protein
MASRGTGGEPKKDDGMTVVLVMLGSVCILIFLLWMAGSVKFIQFWAPKLVSIAQMWLWLPGDAGAMRFTEIARLGQLFLDDPKKVSIFAWLGFFNKAAFIPCLLITLALSGALIRILLKKTESVKRSFKPQQLAIHLSHVFTGIAPVLHLRKDISSGKDKFWRRQLFPHEALLNEKVNGKPLIVDGAVDQERVAEYFRGIVMKKVPKTSKVPAGGLVPDTVNGRLISKMLGNQVVNLLTDRGKNPCFPDRFSPAGKVIYALLCAHAFGGDEGKSDYAKARDQLNNSARGAAHGFANLSVAQWLYDKYRNNPIARKLFAVHHWEYTYLYELLVQAKRQGKCGHWEFIWLKPMSRILFYVMNTVGRLTPHTESAAAFTQYIYERRVAKKGRIPLQKFETGVYGHVIYVEKAVKGLSMEWDRWQDGEDDDNLWWLDDSLWKRLSGIRLESPAPPPVELAVETAFDRAMTIQAKDEETKRRTEAAAAASAAISASGGSANITW